MADRRMMSKKITDTDAFQEMPVTAKYLYCELVWAADDDGFVGNPRTIMRKVGATDDDIRVLIAKRYVLIFESGVIVIKHWRIHNYIQSDRYRPTTYVEEKSTLALDEKGAYTEAESVPCIQNGYRTDTQDRIEIELGEDSLGENYARAREEQIPPKREDVEAYIKEGGYRYVNVDEFMDFYESKGWMVGKAKMKKWTAAVRNWNTRKKDEEPKREEVSYDSEKVKEKAHTVPKYIPKAEKQAAEAKARSAEEARQDHVDSLTASIGAGAWSGGNTGT